jgi:Taurine catabolism dioxygenase TauD, TfdA family
MCAFVGVSLCGVTRCLCGTCLWEVALLNECDCGHCAAAPLSLMISLPLACTYPCALQLFNELAASEELRLDYMLQPGEIQLLSNHTVLHARSEFQDASDVDSRRHLLRCARASILGDCVCVCLCEGMM